MDGFPTRKNFNDMMQNPRQAFRDAQLKTVDIERDPIGLPRARAGTFADVYRATLKGGQSRAVRVFATSQPERQERYQAIHDHLRQVSVPCLVPFTYHDAGVRATDGKWYPLITMEWVSGDTLFDWLEKRTSAADGRSIAAVAEKWRTVVRDLRDAKIAHGDLQHANVLVTDAGELKLVDYDCMCVPQLVGRRNLEIGVEPYQHPSRDGNTPLSLSLDNFSALFIYVGIRALAAEPGLWRDFVTRPLNDKILFRKEDFDSPGTSALFKRLGRSPDADVRRLATVLADLPRLRLEQLPFLEELVGQFDFKHVRTLLDKRDFDAVVGLLARNNKQPADAPADLQARIKDAQTRVAALAALLAAVDAGDEQRMMTLATAPQLQAYPRAADGLAVARDAAAVIPVLQRLEAAKASRQWREFVREWDASQSVLTRPQGILRRSGARYAADVASWRERNRLCDETLAAIRAPQPNVSALRATWKRLTDLGGHPECDAHKATVGRLLASLPAAQSSPPAVAPGPRPHTPGPVAPPAGSRPPTPVPQSGTLPVTATPPFSGPAPTVGTPTSGSRPGAAVGAAPPPVGSTAVAAGRSPMWEKAARFVVGVGDAVIRRLPMGDQMSRRLSMAAALPGAVRRAWLLGRSATVGAVCGAVLGAAWIVFSRQTRASAVPWEFMCELLRLGPWIVGSSLLAIFVGHNQHLDRPSLDWRHVLTSIAAGGAVGVVVWWCLNLLQRFIPDLQFMRWTDAFDGWPRWLLHECGVLAVWSSLGTGIGLAATRAIPNLGWRPAACAGAIGGLTAACGFEMLLRGAVSAGCGPWLASIIAGLLACAVLGLAVAALCSWGEAMTRRHGLELRGAAPLPMSLGLGPRPITAGAAPKCDVYVSYGNRPVAYKYWVENGQVYLLDYASGLPARLAAGDRRTLGPVTLTVVDESVNAASPVATSGTRPAYAPVPGAVAPTPMSTGSGSRPGGGAVSSAAATQAVPPGSASVTAPATQGAGAGAAGAAQKPAPGARMTSPPLPAPPPRRP